MYILNQVIICQKMDEFQVILVIINPYHRLVSGFWNNNGNYRHLWDKNTPITFRNFVEEITGTYKHIDRHHFTPQLSENWQDRIKFHQKLKIYVINNIDYQYLEDIILLYYFKVYIIHDIYKYVQ